MKGFEPFLAGVDGFDIELGVTDQSVDSRVAKAAVAARGIAASL